MTRNEARGILIRMQSEIENPYSTEAQALGIAIEKMERDYETEYWEAQWQIDQLEKLLSEATCKVENRPVDERNEREHIICRLNGMDALMGDFAVRMGRLEEFVDEEVERIAEILKVLK